MAAEKTNCLCPNCQQPATREGNKITCESCDAIYTITKKDGARVQKTGRFEALEQRVDALEGKKQGDQQQGDQQQDDQQQDDQQQDDSNEDEGEGEIFPR